MNKKVETKPDKKRYSKPQITQVKLVTTAATLGLCWSSASGLANQGACQDPFACPAG